MGYSEVSYDFIVINNVDLYYFECCFFGSFSFGLFSIRMEDIFFEIIIFGMLYGGWIINMFVCMVKFIVGEVVIVMDVFIGGIEMMMRMISFEFGVIIFVEI